MPNIKGLIRSKLHRPHISALRERLAERRAKIQQREHEYDIEAKELGITRPLAGRIQIGTMVRSPKGAVYTITDKKENYYVTASGSHIPKTKIDMFTIVPPSRKSVLIKSAKGLIVVGKRAYKS